MLQGLPGGPVRKPLGPLSDDEKRELEKALTAIVEGKPRLAGAASS
jgi:dihydrodipicolinate synthase/N-acetylneuraminate lyase